MKFWYTNELLFTSYTTLTVLAYVTSHVQYAYVQSHCYMYATMLWANNKHIKSEYKSCLAI